MRAVALVSQCDCSPVQIEQLLGRQGTSEQLGTGVLRFLVIETNGAIEQVDSLKAAFQGATPHRPACAARRPRCRI